MENSSRFNNPGFLSENHNSTSPVCHQTSPLNIIPKSPTSSQNYTFSAPYGRQTAERVNDTCLQAPTVLDDFHSKRPEPYYPSLQHCNNNNSPLPPSHSNQFSDYRQNNYTETAIDGGYKSATSNHYHSKNPIQRDIAPDHTVSSVRTEDDDVMPPSASGVNAAPYFSQTSGNVYSYSPSHSAHQTGNFANHEKEKVNNLRPNFDNNILPVPGRGSSLDEKIAHFFVNTTELKQKQESSDLYPVEVTFIDRTTGTEYAADGNVIPASHWQTFEEAHPFRKPEISRPVFSASHNENAGQPYTNSQLQSYPSSQLQSYTSSHVQPYLSSQAHPYPNNQEQPYPNSQAKPYPNRQEQPYPSSQLQSYPSNQAQSYPNSQEQPYSSSQAHPYPISQAQPYPSNQLQSYPTSQEKPNPSSHVLPYGQQYINNQQWSTGQHVTSAAVVQQPFNYNYIHGQSPPQKISNYVPLSIIVSLCFCFPLGLSALFKAREANRLRDAGKYHEAAKKAQSSLSANIFGIILGIIIIGAAIGYNVWRWNNIK